MSNDTQVVTLTDFLLARLAEDEADARALQATWESSPPSTYDFTQTGWLEAGEPARVLADVEAKRRIVEWCAQAETETLSWAAGTRFGYPAEIAALRDVARVLASVYADHPDYREEWKP